MTKVKKQKKNNRNSSTDNNIWENGGEVNKFFNNAIESTGPFQDYCYGDIPVKPKPYGPPNCDQFGIIYNSSINRVYFRGCNLSEAEDGVIDPSLMVCDLEGACGIGVSNPFFPDFTSLRECDNTAPGGLANAEETLDMKDNEDGDDSNYLRNGFIMSMCECQFNRRRDISYENYCDNKDCIKNNSNGERVEHLNSEIN